MMDRPFSILIREEMKTVEMIIRGTFKAQEYEDFVQEYLAKTSSLDGKQYVLKVDCKGMDLLTPGEVEKLQGSFRRYRETGFHKVIFVITPVQSILQMQLERVARSTRLMNIEVVIK